MPGMSASGTCPARCSQVKIAGTRHAERFVVPQAKLWWPHNHGAQPLYEWTAVLRRGGRELDRRSRKFGIRSVDQGEKKLVKEYGLDIYDMRYIDEIGMKRAMEEALEGVDEHTHLHVSFDVDFLDPAIAPGVGTTVPGGPNYREAQLVMEMIADTGRMASLDIVELNPIIDKRNRTGKLAVDLVESLFGKSTLMRD